MIRAFQALCPGSNPGIRIIFFIVKKFLGAGVAKPGQRRKVQGLVLQRSKGSNPFPCIFLVLSTGEKTKFIKKSIPYTLSPVKNHIFLLDCHMSFLYVEKD